MSKVTIRAQLDKILAPHDKAWQRSIVDSFVSAANGEFKGWIEYLKGAVPNLYNERRQPQYVIFTPVKGLTVYNNMRPMRFDDAVVAMKAGSYSVNKKQAVADGKRVYQQIRDAFVIRVTDKIASVVLEKPVKIVGDIHFMGRVEGSLKVSVGKDFFGMKVAVKTNFRYGENAANGNLTVYSQYPVTFVSAKVGGTLLTDVSEEILANVISGLAIDHKERTARAIIDARKARRKEKNALINMKMAANDVADCYESISRYQINASSDTIYPGHEAHIASLVAEKKAKIAKICEKYNIADPGSKKAALALRKSLLAEIKSIGSVK